uniref:Uncharacterized protein n=1 Tax=Rangifer tarandus platyrhynchus TaxID=3082113 RepID=A0ACB0E500_RANTA|nr:unnamed protein product [Rangifer tarandus platyrhynchus]
MAPTRSAMFWAKSREIVEGGEAGKKLKGLRRREGKGGARRRRREIGCGRSGANEPIGRGSRRSVSTREPSGLSNRSRPGQRSPALYDERLGEGKRAWLCLGEGLRGGPGGRGARGAVAPRGDVRSSWSRGLPPAADVRMVNNRECSVEGGIPRCSLRSPSSRPSPRPRPPGSLGWWGYGRARGERRFGRRSAPARVARAAASTLAGCSEERRRARCAGYLAQAWEAERSYARRYTDLRERSADGVGAGLIRRLEAVDPLSYANTRVSNINNIREAGD